MSDFRLFIERDGIAVITWDVRDRSMNILTKPAFTDFDQLIDDALDNDSVRGIIITSGKDSFAGGIDLNMLSDIVRSAGKDPAPGVLAFLMNVHRVLRKLERAGMDDKNKGGKPVVCAIPGLCAGIGTEIALACHHRIMSDTKSAKIGLPEIRVGLFPGAGGTTRYSRLVGTLAAAPVLLEGKMLSPSKAKMAQLIDNVVEPEALLDSARNWIMSAIDDDLVKPWDRKGWRMPGGAPYHPQGFMTFVGANAMVNARTKGVYPAAKAMLSAIYEGAMVPFDTALRIEARWFTSVLLDPVSSNMVRSLFINKEVLEKGANRPDVTDQSVRRLGVVGAGMMGAGIAHVAALAGVEVVLVDRTEDAANDGKTHIDGIIEKSVGRKFITQEEKAEVLKRIETTANYHHLKGCDLVVEAVFEDPAVKADAIQKIGSVVGHDCVVATNTSTLPISDLSQAIDEPQRFIGIHFFSPVHRMSLVEVIKGTDTGDLAVAKALDFVRQLRKTPIIVGDARFFYANRCILAFGKEGLRMINEGIKPALVENAASLLGFPVGPLQLIDETSISLNATIARASREVMGDGYPDQPSDEVLFLLEDKGRLGRKTGGGFYDYDKSGKRIGLWAGLTNSFPLSDIQPSVQEVQNRLMMIQALEAVRAFENGVLTDVREGDVGAILGWGFAPWTGGPFSWLDRIGAAKAVEICQRLETEHGSRFAPPQALLNMAKSGTTFYSEHSKTPTAA
ncbi:MAG: 3-hydroxyacyl-CoA dehydrogenase [Boseongicola sp.]|nr:MAG: 3-hydroxyacyl-CoA dehydrogenase [Boseongicola sp.]